MITAGGAAAQAEIGLMISKTATTAMTVPILAMKRQLHTTGPAVAARALSPLRRKVRANRRRLSKA